MSIGKLPKLSKKVSFGNNTICGDNVYIADVSVIPSIETLVTYFTVHDKACTYLKFKGMNNNFINFETNVMYPLSGMYEGLTPKKYHQFKMYAFIPLEEWSTISGSKYVDYIFPIDAKHHLQFRFIITVC
jgi:hypothetical protein